LNNKARCENKYVIYSNLGQQIQFSINRSIRQVLNNFGFHSIIINRKELDAKYYDIGYKCNEEK